MRVSDPTFPSADLIEPADGSIEISKNYIYYPDGDAPLHVATVAPISRSIVRVQRIPNDPLRSAPPHGLKKGAILRFEAVEGGYYCVSKVRLVAGDIIELYPALTRDPLPGSLIKRIEAYSEQYMNMWVYDLIEKGKIQGVGGRYYWID